MRGCREQCSAQADPITENAYAWIINWDDYFAARVVDDVLRAGAQARVATSPFTLNGRAYGAGSVVVPAGLVADGQREAVIASLRAARDLGVQVTGVATGLSEQGIDLGSPSMEAVTLPKAAIIIGSGVNAYEAGDIWHLIDQRFSMPVALLDKADLPRVALDRYTHLLMVDGSYGSIADQTTAALASWVKAGGILVAQRGAAEWLISEKSFALKAKAVDEKEKKKEKDEQGEGQESPPQKPYAERDDWEANKVIGGAIFEARLDITHPLGFGFHSQSLPVFHRGTDWLDGSENPFENVAVYADQPLLSGFASEENIESMKASVAVRQTRMGKGSVILFADIPAFRAFWYGSSRLWLNALFFGSAVERVDH